MVITLNGEELPDWIDSSLLGVDVMFDEMTYREMEFALKEVMKAEDNRVATFREILLGDVKATVKNNAVLNGEDYGTGLNDSQRRALERIRDAEDVAFVMALRVPEKQPRLSRQSDVQ